MTSNSPIRCIWRRFRSYSSIVYLPDLLIVVFITERDATFAMGAWFANHLQAVAGRIGDISIKHAGVHEISRLTLTEFFELMNGPGQKGEQSHAESRLFATDLLHFKAGKRVTVVCAGANKTCYAALPLL